MPLRHVRLAKTIVEVTETVVSNATIAATAVIVEIAKAATGIVKIATDVGAVVEAATAAMKVRKAPIATTDKMINRLATSPSKCPGISICVTRATASCE
jgi:hypothetical protein